LTAEDISRKSFLKITGLLAAGLALPGIPGVSSLAGLAAPSSSLGRLARSLRYYEEPSTTSKELGYYVTDTVVDLLEEAQGDPPAGMNSTWWRSKDGWLNSSFIQPVRKDLNIPRLDVPAGGFLAEVTVPFTQSWRVGEDRQKRGYRYYYGTTHWVVSASLDRSGETWYVVQDDLDQRQFLALARHFRTVSAEELAPISPGVEKHIEIDLARQALTAYEAGKAVFSASVASGRLKSSTPVGEFRVERKNPSRHMANMAEEVGAYDLPGVPWVCFFEWTGVSLHGTYWHNNFGRPMSHGCVNLTHAAAKWLYRWTEPFVPVNKDYLESKNGTRIVIF
jgi:hypothetical protein